MSAIGESFLAEYLIAQAPLINAEDTERLMRSARGPDIKCRAPRPGTAQTNLWKSLYRDKPPAIRAAWLLTPAAIAEIGPERRKSLLKIARDQCAECRRSACSGARMDEFELAGAPFHNLGMVLSRHETRFGIDGTPSRRWTPPQAVVTEDGIDGMDWLEAAAYEFPRSPSADVIERIRSTGAAPVSGARDLRI